MPVNAFIYYGITFGIGDVGGNLYLSQIMAGLAEAPGLLLSLYFMHNYGRRLFTAYNLLLTGLVCLFALFFVNSTSTTLIMVVAAKFFITNSYNVIIVQGSEIFPTVLRTAAGGSITILSRAGASSAPFVKDMVSYEPTLIRFLSYICRFATEEWDSPLLSLAFSLWSPVPSLISYPRLEGKTFQTPSKTPRIWNNCI